MPTDSALQTFYGTIPLILVIAGGFLRSSMLLKDILSRLKSVESGLSDVRERLVALETRAGGVLRP
ncbi:MAG TPA: hypothetical protein VFO36_08735 [Nitrospiraceae bacterium]|nr:hypothetical protein [Nitrospiraceae bacterium]